MNTNLKRIHRPGERRYTKWVPTLNAKRPEISELRTIKVNELIAIRAKRGQEYTFTSMVEECIDRVYDQEVKEDTSGGI